MEVFECLYKNKSDHVIAKTVLRREQLVDDAIVGAFRHSAASVEIRNDRLLPYRLVNNLRYRLGLIGVKVNLTPTTNS